MLVMVVPSTYQRDVLVGRGMKMRIGDDGEKERIRCKLGFTWSRVSYSLGAKDYG